MRINLTEARAQLSSVLRRVENGETVILCRRDEPVAELRPLRLQPPAPVGSEPRRFGLGKGLYRVDECFFEVLEDRQE